MTGAASAASVPLPVAVEPQPFLAAFERLVEALEYLGSPMEAETYAALLKLAGGGPTPDLAQGIQELLDPLCLAYVHINPEARVKVDRGPAAAVLQSGGWKSFLIKVHNEGAVRAVLECESPNAAPVLHHSSGQPEPKPENLLTEADLAQRFLEVAFYRGRPLEKALSGLAVEYKVLQVYTTADAPREAALQFHIGEGTQDIGHRSTLSVLFAVKPAVKLVFDVRDVDGAPVMASFTLRDNVERLADIGEAWTRPKDYRHARALNEHYARPGIPANPPLTGVYPLPSRRVASRDPYPDFFFQPQIYRTTGEEVLLAPGKYDVSWTRGPEYLPQSRTITIPEGVAEHHEVFQLTRWIHLTQEGWYSGDHHVHAGGCSHYESPEAGVQPPAMMRQAMGEDLNVACVLTWGPCWYHQKSYFEGKTHALSSLQNLMRYDVEVSGFPSSHAGHVCLLRLTEDDYPGTTRIEEWPSWTLPVLQWGKAQGGVVGYAHSGWGLEPTEPTEDLPNLVMPKFDGIGANEYIVTVTHDAVDFISAGDTPLTWELNIWYHALNCGFRTKISGESDYPCIFDERVGMIRSYVPVAGALDFDHFAEQLKLGNSYVSDGRSHVLDFRMGEAALGSGVHETHLAGPDTVRVTARVAAHLPEVQDDAGKIIADSGVEGRPYWHVEKARVGESRRVPVELVVNGIPVAVQEIEADGTWREVAFDHAFDRSSWVALRVKYSSHTNPLYVVVDNTPVRASRSSADWCRRAVDQCWAMKSSAIHADERAEASGGYDHARATFDAILEEALPDAAAPLLMPDPMAAGLPEGAQVFAADGPQVLRSPAWKLAKPAAACGTGNLLRANTMGDRLRWLLEDVPRGRYEIFVWVPQGSSATEAQYAVGSGERSETVVLDQTANPCNWQSLGVHRLRRNAFVELSNAEGQGVVAGPLALVRR
jgi:hypothetical protein